MLDLNSLGLEKYTTKRKRGATSERAEICDLTAQLLNQDIKKVLGLTRHLQPDQIYRLYRESNNTPQFWWANYRQKYMKRSIESIVRERLEKFPEFRERKNRGVFLAKLALIELKLLDKQKNGVMFTFNELSAFGIKYDSFRNAWDSVTRENVHLRGSDYDEGKKLEEKVLRQKGYIK